MCKNPNCDGGWGENESGEVRRVPLPAGNANLCRECFDYEMDFRRERNKILSPSEQHPIREWDRLAIVASGDQEETNFTDGFLLVSLGDRAWVDYMRGIVAKHSDDEDAAEELKELSDCLFDDVQVRPIRKYPTLNEGRGLMVQQLLSWALSDVDWIEVVRNVRRGIEGGAK